MITDPEIREAFERGREAVAAGWEWARGQRAISHYERDHVNVVTTGLVTAVFDCPGDPMHGQPLVFIHDDGGRGLGPGVIVPDFRCPGTRGHLLDQVRRAYGHSETRHVNVERLRPGSFAVTAKVWDEHLYRWVLDAAVHEVTNGITAMLGGGSTEVEALLAARKAAPR